MCKIRLRMLGLVTLTLLGCNSEDGGQSVDSLEAGGSGATSTVSGGSSSQTVTASLSASAGGSPSGVGGSGAADCNALHRMGGLCESHSDSSDSSVCVGSLDTSKDPALVACSHYGNIICGGGDYTSHDVNCFYACSDCLHDSASPACLEALAALETSNKPTCEAH